MKVQPITFKGQPENYAKISNALSRSAQPQKDDFIWLKEQGVTDIINFRTMFVSGVDYDEKTLVESLGMKYHNIPSVTKEPKEGNILEFLKMVESVKEQGGKTHIHCMAGADRTGMYSYIYKTLNKIGSQSENQAEMLKMGHDKIRYPNLLPWINKFINKMLKK